MKYEWMICGKCDSLDDVPTAADVISVDGMPVLDKCEQCGKLIIDGEDSFSDEEGATLCPDCYKEAQL